MTILGRRELPCHPYRVVIKADSDGKKRRCPACLKEWLVIVEPAGERVQFPGGGEVLRVRFAEVAK